MEALVAFGCLLLAGCGRVGFEPADAATDAPADAPACRGTGMWGPAVRLDELDTVATEYGGQISGDGLALYFDSNVGGDEEIYVATRSSRTASFGPAVRLAELGTSFTEGDATVTADGLELWFSSDRVTVNAFCLYVATRATTADAWSGVTRQDQLCTTTNASGPYLTPDGLTLVYNDMSDGFGEGDLYITQRATRDVAFQPGASLGFAGTNGYAVLSRDQLAIYFEANIGASLELRFATRASTSALFGAPQRLDAIDTAGSNEDISLTDDEAELYFASDRDGSHDLWRTSRPCL